MIRWVLSRYPDRLGPRRMFPQMFPCLPPPPPDFGSVATIATPLYEQTARAIGNAWQDPLIRDGRVSEPAGPTPSDLDRLSEALWTLEPGAFDGRYKVHWVTGNADEVPNGLSFKLFGSSRLGRIRMDTRMDFCATPAVAGSNAVFAFWFVLLHEGSHIQSQRLVHGKLFDDPALSPLENEGFNRLVSIDAEPFSRVSPWFSEHLADSYAALTLLAWTHNDPAALATLEWLAQSRATEFQAQLADERHGDGSALLRLVSRVRQGQLDPGALSPTERLKEAQRMTSENLVAHVRTDDPRGLNDIAWVWGVSGGLGLSPDDLVKAGSYENFLVAEKDRVKFFAMMRVQAWVAADHEGRAVWTWTSGVAGDAVIERMVSQDAELFAAYQRIPTADRQQAYAYFTGQGGAASASVLALHGALWRSGMSALADGAGLQAQRQWVPSARAIVHFWPSSRAFISTQGDPDLSVELP